MYVVSTASAVQLGVINYTYMGYSNDYYANPGQPLTQQQGAGLALNLTAPGTGVRSLGYWANWGGPGVSVGASAPIPPTGPNANWPYYYSVYNEWASAVAEYQALLGAGALS